MAKMLARLTVTLPNAAKAVVTFSRPRLQTFWKYAKVEMRPPTMSEFGQVQEGINKIVQGVATKRYMQLTVKESLINAIICLEILFIFFVGEIIGKGNLIGYYIPGAWTIHGEDSRKAH